MCVLCGFFFFNDTATTEIYTLSLHDALPIWHEASGCRSCAQRAHRAQRNLEVPNATHHSPKHAGEKDRKSTRLNSSHGYISYAVFCLKKKKDCKHLRVCAASGRLPSVDTPNT